MGKERPVELLFIIEKRRKVSGLIKLIKVLDPTAMYSVSDVKSVYEGHDVIPKRSFVGSSMLTGKWR